MQVSTSSFVLGLSLLVLSSCGSPVLAPRGGPVPPAVCAGGSPVVESIFLIGDAGDPALPVGESEELVDPVLLALQRDVAASVASLGVKHVHTIFLGDNVYWDGLPPKGHPDRPERERKLQAQITASAPAAAIFTMGNHDWHIEGPEGWMRAVAQRNFLRTFSPRVTMHPPGGCAGPDHVDVGEHLRIVFIDLLGFDHAVEDPIEHRKACSGRKPLEAYYDLAAEFDFAGTRHTALAMHHPLLTAGPHGGHYTWKQHIFPLTDFWPWAWLPLPVIGSAYPLSRQLGVTGTDVSSDRYKRDIRGVYRAATPWAPGVFIAGHEHSLQLHRDYTGTYYVVSGAGSANKVDRVEADELDTVMLAAAQAGYMRLDVQQDASLELTATAVSDGGETAELIRHCLANGPPVRRRRTEPTYQR